VLAVKVATLAAMTVPLPAKDAVTPAGRFNVFRLTAPANPDIAVMLIVSVAVRP